MVARDYLKSADFFSERGFGGRKVGKLWIRCILGGFILLGVGGLVLVNIYLYYFVFICLFEVGFGWDFMVW